MSAGEVSVWGMLEVPKGIRIVKRSVFGKGLDVIATLYSMQQHVATIVGAINKLACGIKVKTPRVTATFAKQFKVIEFWVITPNALLELGTANGGSHGAALASI